MTEAEWLECAGPGRMIEFLRGRVSDRKLRLLGAACCRRVWPLLIRGAVRKVVKVNERYADGVVGASKLASALSCAGGWARGERAARTVLGLGFDPDVAGVAAGCADLAGAGDAERRTQAQFVRCIFGNPFLPAPSISALWLKRGEETVRKLAQAIYTDRAFDRLPVLADALEDAGCTDADILAHCRSGGVHVRGCWAVDLLLGKT